MTTFPKLGRTRYELAPPDVTATLPEAMTSEAALAVLANPGRPCDQCGGRGRIVPQTTHPAELSPCPACTRAANPPCATHRMDTGACGHCEGTGRAPLAHRDLVAIVRALGALLSPLSPDCGQPVPTRPELYQPCTLPRGHRFGCDHDTRCPVMIDTAHALRCALERKHAGPCTTTRADLDPR